MLDWGSYGDRHYGGLASLPGCPGVSNLNPVVSLCSTTGYRLGCLRHLLEGRFPVQRRARLTPGTS